MFKLINISDYKGLAPAYAFFTTGNILPWLTPSAKADIIWLLQVVSFGLAIIATFYTLRNQRRKAIKSKKSSYDGT